MSYDTDSDDVGVGAGGSAGCGVCSDGERKLLGLLIHY